MERFMHISEPVLLDRAINLCKLATLSTSCLNLPLRICLGCMAGSVQNSSKSFGENKTHMGDFENPSKCKYEQRDNVIPVVFGRA